MGPPSQQNTKQCAQDHTHQQHYLPRPHAQDLEGLPFASGTWGRTEERASSEGEEARSEKEEWSSCSRS